MATWSAYKVPHLNGKRQSTAINSKGKALMLSKNSSVEKLSAGKRMNQMFVGH